jgi:hypothetical protein
MESSTIQVVRFRFLLSGFYVFIPSKCHNVYKYNLLYDPCIKRTRIFQTLSELSYYDRSAIYMKVISDGSLEKEFVLFLLPHSILTASTNVGMMGSGVSNYNIFDL